MKIRNFGKKLFRIFKEDKKLKESLTLFLALVIILSNTIFNIESIYSNLIIVSTFIVLFVLWIKEVYTYDKRNWIMFGVINLVIFTVIVPTLAVFSLYFYPIIDSLLLLGLSIAVLSIILSVSTILVSALVLLYLSKHLDFILDEDNEKADYAS